MDFRTDTAELDISPANNITDADLEQEFQNMERVEHLKNLSLPPNEQPQSTYTLFIDPKDIHICKWDECDTEFKEMDHLVDHVSKCHILSLRQLSLIKVKNGKNGVEGEGNETLNKTNSEEAIEDEATSRNPMKVCSSDYSCQWKNCPRKGFPQHSRFALLSHIRTHTGERPFYCLIPECLKSFTRCDALLKHSKSVHELEGNSLLETFETLQKREAEQKKYFYNKNEFKIDLNSSGKKIALGYENRIMNESTMSHDDFINSFDSFRNGEKITSDGYIRKLINHYKIKNIEFNPSVINKITKKTKKSIEKFNKLKDDIGNGNRNVTKIVSINDLDDETIEKLSVDELNVILETQTSYYSKLVKLRRLFDDELVKQTDFSRYYWLKKQSLLNQLLINEESSINK